jgi:hypothetical protein
MDLLKATTYAALNAEAVPAPGQGLDWSPGDGGKECTNTTLVFNEWHCSETVPGVGVIHTHWWLSTTADPRLLHIRVRSEGTGALTGARSRAEFTTFRACTNSEPATGGCPAAP